MRIIAGVALLLLFPSAADAQELAIEAARADNAVYRNAMYLYLRIAGVAWIGIEWIAAIVLWRSYRLMRDAAGDLHLDS